MLFLPVLELQGNSCVQLFHWPHEVTHAVLTSPLLCILRQWESLNLLTTLLLIGIGCFSCRLLCVWMLWTFLGVSSADLGW